MKKFIYVVILLFIISQSISAQTKSETNFKELEILLKTATGDIFGTLTTPEKIKKSPVVLIIAGSGPTDRDCTSPLGIKT
jgi:hypothetical protein